MIRGVRGFGRFEDAHRLGLGTVEQSRDLGIRIDGDKAAAELVALADLDQPGVVFRAGMAEGEQLFEHDRDLDAVGRAERVELQRVAADRQFLLMRRAGDRPVDVGETAAVVLVPGPDLGRRVFGCISHEGELPALGCDAPRCGEGGGI